MYYKNSTYSKVNLSRIQNLIKYSMAESENAWNKGFCELNKK